MKVLVFEWLSGGGLWHDPSESVDIESAICRQGAAMANAVVEDFLAGGVDVDLMVDSRFNDVFAPHSRLQKRAIQQSDDLPSSIQSSASTVDRVLVIAPETDGRLLSCLNWLEEFSCKLISPGKRFVEVASDKQLTCDVLEAAGFDSFPRGKRLSDFRIEQVEEFLPGVLKPVDGAGSDDVLFLDKAHGKQTMQDWLQAFSGDPYRIRIERFVAGTPVSISAICKRGRVQFLPPTQQKFDREPFGEYIGASSPIDEDISNRALRLAKSAINALPPTIGYVGMDLVIAEDSRNDVLIEVNPRLTMSYLRLREIENENLALAMLSD